MKNELTKIFWLRLRSILCCAFLLFPTTCITKSDKLPDSRALNLGAQSPKVSPVMTNVSLQLFERTKETLSFQLRNDTDHPIYTSYLPPDQGNITKFLSYGLERKTSTGDFKPYGKGFHFAPALAPLAAETAIQFRIIYPPKEKGEYRVIVGYYDDEQIYR